MSKNHFLAIGLIALIILLDQLSKQLILSQLSAPIALTSFFNLTLVWNPGISFGLLQNMPNGHHILTAVTLLITAALFVWQWRSSQRFEHLSLGLIIGGSLGNILDRLQHGAVVDFIDIHAAAYHFPAFNIADSAITCGAILLVLYPIFSKQTDTTS